MSSEDIKLPRALSAKYEGDFAYPTVKDRIPVILTRIVDRVCRLKTDDEFIKEHGEVGLEDLKQICGLLSKLKNEIQTNKPIIPLTDGGSDVALWNNYLAQVKASESSTSWFNSAWLYVECYFYRRVAEVVSLSTSMKQFDPFGSQKCHAFKSSLQAINSFGEHLLGCIKDLNPDKPTDVETIFKQYLQVSLWGNKCDLSISAGAENSQNFNPITQLVELKKFLLRDDSDRVWKKLMDLKQSVQEPHIDFVLDNAGFELFTDLCLAEFLLASGIAHSIRFHGKTLPWFVSDVTKVDFDWTISQLNQSEFSTLSALGAKWNNRLQSGSWKYVDDEFWCTPLDFAQMNTVRPSLYSELSNANFIFFKGDLNYRKLTGDFKWECTVPFHTALRGFHPAPLCALRTLKSDIVVGLEPGVEKTTAEIEDNWMISGNWAVIQMWDEL